MSTPNNAAKKSLAGAAAKYMLLFLAFLILAFAGYTWLTLSYSYSTGERAGFLQKTSKKGWICKTWEGELSLVALPGAAPEKFEFSILDDAVATRVNAAVGQRVSLTYEQHKGIPTSCFGETEYFVTDLKVVPPAVVP